MGGREELVELLGRAGLEVVGDWRTEEVLPPPIAWRHVIARDTAPTVTVAGDRPDLIAELNAEWHRLASDAGILDGDGVFLIDFPDSRSPGWARVRLTDGWDLAGVLGARSGQPEFVTLSLDGDAMVGATTEEYAVRLVALDRIKARQEEAARAAGAETPQERAAAWASLFEGPQPPVELLESWANGLSLNPATPRELRPGLVGLSSYAIYGALPTETVDALLAHPDWNLRMRAVEQQPNITPEQWSRVILGEQDERQRWILAMVAADRRAELPEDTCRALAADPSARVRSEIARLTCLPADLSVALAADPDGGVRYAACTESWPYLDQPARQALLTDSHGIARTRALLLHHREHPMPLSVFETLDAKREALETCLLEHDLAEQVARHGESAERLSLAGNPRLAPDLIALLAEDPDDHVRFTVSKRADLTEEQRAAVRYDFDPDIHYFPLDWVVALHDDQAAMRRLAASSHPLVRRNVARARHLPPDVASLLANDEDRVVQLFLAESCDDAPADMLMRVWQWWDGSLTAPDRPHGHPNFPRHDLLRYADDPNPRMRRLALDDPQSTPELVERLSRDRNEEVRYRAACDPRLSPAAVAWLLEDPHEYIRSAAARHSRMPAGILVRLLMQGGGSAETAARNPALPVEVMRQMVELLSSSATAAD
ncbi:PE-PGRS family protein [Streptomyces sp. NBC_00285]|uniref:HEAT repeat domain-containing protein n=1 Tax=Streptomyces sp. NBC_00285 TaxID=2975700 RepID=UPI002E29FF8B|nr:HEAT repeat domain-containing protein [Streptomyces sp. NBC_00285]